MNKEKVTAALTAAGLLTGVGVQAQASTNGYETNEQITSNEVDTNTVLDSLYQEQMLIPVIEQLKAFYSTVDNKDIIKKAFPNAYSLLDANLGYTVISYGTNTKTYIPNSQDYIKDINRNNQFILALKIKPAGNSRDIDSGLIRDENAMNGFRLKTDEDKQLIDEYSSILANAKIIDENLIALINSLNNNEDITDDLQSFLWDTYQKQITYLNQVKSALNNFYNEIDVNNVIKRGYPSAYNAYSFEIHDDLENINTNINETLYGIIMRNNELINNLEIFDPTSARNNDYGIIMDADTEYGFRTKTEEDKKLIEQYNNIIANSPKINQEIINMLNMALEKSFNSSQTLH